MVRVVASPRRRRRLVWAAATLAALGAVAGIALSLPSSHAASGPSVTGPVTPLPPPPRSERLAAADRREVVGTLLAFLQTAVIRDHTARAYDLVTPALRQGLTRAQWATGTIPVVPYPRHSHLTAMQLVGSFRDDVITRVSLEPPAGSDVHAMSFDVELKAFGTGAHRHWLVDSWVPVAGGDYQPPRPGDMLPITPFKRRLSDAWLLLPAGLIALAMATPLAYMAFQWHRGRRLRGT